MGSLAERARPGAKRGEAVQSYLHLAPERGAVRLAARRSGAVPQEKGPDPSCSARNDTGNQRTPPAPGPARRVVLAAGSFLLESVLL